MTQTSEQEIEALRRRIAELEAQQPAPQAGGATIAQGTANTVASQKAIAVGGSVQGGVTQNNLHIEVLGEAMDAAGLLQTLLKLQRPAPDLEQATRDYLTGLVDRYRYLDFRGMGISDRVPLKLPLLQMYVPLKARQEMPDGDTWDRARLRLAGREMGEEEQAAIGARVSEPRPLLELLRENDGLIVLGDPGAGKTTFLKHIALTLATGQAGRLGLPTLLPVLAPLSGYANALSEGDLPLDRFIVRFYRDRGIGAPMAELLGQALHQGRVLLLLDGLDEVKEPAQRHLVVERVVDFFTTHRKAGNRFLITSRVVGYAEVRPRVEGLAEATLVDFDDDEIRLFVDQWTLALEQAASGATDIARIEAEQERSELLEAVARNPGVRSLATNPLLLTILALMKRQGVTLPERRVELYQKYVDTLLYHWNLARSLGGRGAVGLEVRETLKTLAPLALWMHRTSPGVGLVKERGVREELGRIFAGRGVADPEAEAERFLADLRSHSGLLLDRGARQYGFIHLTFQEYLAGVAIAQTGQQGIGPIRSELAAHLGDDKWREVSLLCIGYLAVIQQRDEAAGDLLAGLIDPDESGEGAILAGEAILDIGRAGTPPTTRERVAQALLVTLTAADRVPPARRARAGRVLAGVGDPRPGVLEVDRMEFCRVPAGPFLMGSREGDGSGDEQPQHELDLPGFLIGRFPVTVAQFRQFCDDAGFAPADRDALLDPLNHPVRFVSWNEAMSFCDWLTERWRDLGWIGAQQRVTLPSEAEWEKAARGGLEVPATPWVGALDALDRAAVSARLMNRLPARAYPWGDEWDRNRANGWETEIREPSAVGAFPGGASPCGAEELSGNLWEWTRSLWGKELEKPEFRYPYRQEDGREALEASAEVRRVLRGGAFGDAPNHLRCAYRRHFPPEYRSLSVGFRVVVSPYSDL